MLKTPWMKDRGGEETAIPPPPVRDSAAKWVPDSSAKWVPDSSATGVGLLRHVGAGLLRHVGAGLLRHWCGTPLPSGCRTPPRRGLTADPPLTFGGLKCRRRRTRCLSVHLEAKDQGTRLFEYVVPSCFNNQPFAMMRRPQPPASSLSHFLLTEAPSHVVMSPKAEASGRPRPTRPSS